MEKNGLAGSTSLLVLSLLRDGDKYGYEMIAQLALRSEGVFELKEGTLYPVLHQLEREILQVGEMIQDMEMKVNVPRWTVQARQAAGAELLSSASAGVSSVGGVSVEQRTGPCDLSKAKVATIFSAVLLAAVALAVCVAKLS